MVTLAAGVVALVRFPFSDLSHSKVRPAIVLLDAQDEEWVLCQVTSNPYADTRAVALPQSAFASGSLQKLSYARPTKLFTAHVSLLASRAGMLRPEAFGKVLEAVINGFSSQLLR